MPNRPTIFIDADACPVKDEVYRVAERYQLAVKIVANAWIRTPVDPRHEMVVVEDGPDVADDWIAERAQAGDIVITADIPLADRALKAGAAAISPKGRPFTEDSIGAALAQRAVMDHLRSTGEMTGGPSAFENKDRSRFLSTLDEAVNRSLKAVRR
ncbi:MAG: YaiI/YqxD family protein [Maricaulaceae bacterium]|jgi:uncharacterized protein YaiI (UPF0178 family)